MSPGLSQQDAHAGTVFEDPLRVPGIWTSRCIAILQTQCNHLPKDERSNSVRTIDLIDCLILEC